LHIEVKAFFDEDAATVLHLPHKNLSTGEVRKAPKGEVRKAP
jgi:hypothetical protein